MKKNKIIFKKRVTDIWDYPKISSLTNQIESRSNYFEFLDNHGDNKGKIRIYVHIPFCNSFCPFCSYYKKAYKPLNKEEKDRYFSAVVKEILIYSKKEYFKNKEIGYIYFGGGDPSCVEVEYLGDIIKAIKENFNSKDCSTISIEGHVNSLLDENRILAYKKLGVTRVSFGVQTFNEVLRKKLILKPSLDDINNLVDLLNRHGVDYTLDLMYNLPDQTINDVYNDVINAIKLNPTYIDTYSLNLYPNTKFYEDVNKGNIFSSKPSNQHEIEMFKLIKKTMSDNAYKQVGSVMFSAKKNKPHDCLNSYLNNGDMLGIGPSARTFLENRNYRNISSIERYIELIDENMLTAETGNLLNDRDMEDRKMVLFPTVLKIKKEKISNYDNYKDNIKLLVDLGYLTWDNGYLKLTEEGELWPGNIQRLFYSNSRIKEELNSFISTVKDGKNPYNQDYMNIVNKK